MSDTPTIIKSNVPNIEAKCIRCKNQLRDLTLVLNDENGEPTPFLIAYICQNPHCAAFGLLTIAHIP